MNGQRLFLDTFFVQALLDRNDQFHQQCRQLEHHLEDASEVWVTEAVLVEIGNALSSSNREGAARFIRACYRTDNVRVVRVDTPLLERGLALFEARQDKNWGLTDCISFVVMESEGITHALTGDAHFRQAGFVPLLSS